MSLNALARRRGPTLLTVTRVRWQREFKGAVSRDETDLASVVGRRIPYVVDRIRLVTKFQSRRDRSSAIV